MDKGKAEFFCMLKYTLHTEMYVLEVHLHPFILAYGTRWLGPTAGVCM